MKHAGEAALAQLEDLLVEIRALAAKIKAALGGTR
jgi:hypothetical protein